MKCHEIWSFWVKNAEDFRMGIHSYVRWKRKWISKVKAAGGGRWSKCILYIQVMKWTANPINGFYLVFFQSKFDRKKTHLRKRIFNAAKKVHVHLDEGRKYALPLRPLCPHRPRSHCLAQDSPPGPAHNLKYFCHWGTVHTYDSLYLWNLNATSWRNKQNINMKYR